MNADERRYKSITEKIIGCAFEIHKVLGNGFLEKVYENALSHQLRTVGLTVEQQKSVQVFYDGVVVGDYVCDLLVENRIIVELKAVKALDEIHFAQAINYLKATGLKICILLNSGTPKVQVKRVVYKL
ncbi:MAG: GxxExxY protein [bacterium]